MEFTDWKVVIYGLFAWVKMSMRHYRRVENELEEFVKVVDDKVLQKDSLRESFMKKGGRNSLPSDDNKPPPPPPGQGVE